MKTEEIKELIFKSLESWGLNRNNFTIGISCSLLNRWFNDEKIKKILNNKNLELSETSDYLIKYENKVYLMEIECGYDDNYFISTNINSPQETETMKDYFDDGYYESIIEEKGYL